MRIARRAEAHPRSQLLGLTPVLVLATLLSSARGAAADPDKSGRLSCSIRRTATAVLGTLRLIRAIRSTFATGPPCRIEIHNEYLDVSRSPDWRSPAASG